jgi:hypothetical protein
MAKKCSSEFDKLKVYSAKQQLRKLKPSKEQKCLLKNIFSKI